jgi:carboxypeptidase T
MMSDKQTRWVARLTPMPNGSIDALLDMPLGLDVWEVKPDHVILRAAEAQAERLQHMGYHVEQVHLTERYLSTFATAAATAGYHSAASLEQDLRQLANGEPQLVELQEIGRSVENRPIWALRIGERRGSTHKLLFLGCHHAREWVAVEVPYRLAEYLVQHAHQNPVQQWLAQGEIWVAPMVNPDSHE